MKILRSEDKIAKDLSFDDQCSKDVSTCLVGNNRGSWLSIVCENLQNANIYFVTNKCKCHDPVSWAKPWQQGSNVHFSNIQYIANIDCYYYPKKKKKVNIISFWFRSYTVYNMVNIISELNSNKVRLWCWHKCRCHTCNITKIKHLRLKQLLTYMLKQTSMKQINPIYWGIL